LRAPGSTRECRQQAWKRRQQVWERRQQVRERRQQDWEHLGAPRITVKQSGKMTSSLGMLLVRLEIIATTYHSTIFKTHVFGVYSHLSI